MKDLLPGEKEDLTQDLIKYIQTLEDSGKNISKIEKKYILYGYYATIGADKTINNTEWFQGLQDKKFPKYLIVNKAIENAKKLNPKWNYKDIK